MEDLAKARKSRVLPRKRINQLALCHRHPQKACSHLARKSKTSHSKAIEKRPVRSHAGRPLFISARGFVGPTKHRRGGAIPSLTIKGLAARSVRQLVSTQCPPKGPLSISSSARANPLGHAGSGPSPSPRSGLIFWPVSVPDVRSAISKGMDPSAIAAAGRGC